MFRRIPTRMLRAAVPVVTAAALIWGIAGTGDAVGASPAARAAAQFVVMDQNVYLGANLVPLFGKTGSELIDAAAAVYAHMEQVNFPARARAIAREVASTMPVVISVQEAFDWQLGTDPYHLADTYNYRELLVQALSDLGLHYEVVAYDTDFSGALPITQDYSTWAGVIDHDAILARTDLPTSIFQWSNPTGQNYEAAYKVPLGGGYVDILRGWTSLDVTYRSKSYRFIDTHLEAYDAGIRDLQAGELLTAMADSPYPVLLAGDINSLPDDESGPYGMLADAGFADSWNEAMGDAPGWTSGQPDDLDCTLPSQIDHRVDYVLHNDVPFLFTIVKTGNVVGDEASDCTTDTDPPLWPSDHAGVVVTVHLSKP